MIIALPSFAEIEKREVIRIRIMIDLANIFQKFAKEIQFSSKISSVILMHIAEEEIDVWEIVKKKRGFIEKALNGMPATVLAGKKRMRLNQKTNREEKDLCAIQWQQKERRQQILV